MRFLLFPLSDFKLLSVIALPFTIVPWYLRYPRKTPAALVLSLGLTGTRFCARNRYAQAPGPYPQLPF